MKKPRRQKNKLWTGRVVEALYAGNLSTADDAPGRECRPGRHRLHWTKTDCYVCNDCGALFRPVVPDENLGPDATRHALERAAAKKPTKKGRKA